MNPIPQYLSLWEFAHRWHDALPSSVDDSSVTREIRDTLLTLIEAVMRSELTLYDVRVGWTMEGSYMHSPVLDEWPVEEIPKKFEEMFYSGVLDRNTLQAWRLSRDSVFEWCLRDGYDPPDFCIPAWAMTEPKPEALTAKARPEAEDKTKCQEIASRKWAENPRIRIAEMARDREIQIEGNGRLYTEPTVLNWLREVAPDTVKGKPGRPRLENTRPK